MKSRKILGLQNKLGLRMKIFDLSLSHLHGDSQNNWLVSSSIIII